MKATVQVGMRLDPELVERIDAARNGTSRTRWMVEAFEAKLAMASLPRPKLTEIDEEGAMATFELAPPAVPSEPDLPRNGHPVTCRCEECLEARG
jgi:hypothetical protein